MAHNTAPPQDSSARPSGTAAGKSEPRARVQGEGDYEAAERYRQDVKEFLKTSDVADRARSAAPGSAKEERDLALAEEQGKGRSKGDDPVDVGLMYPGRRAEDVPLAAEAERSSNQADD